MSFANEITQTHVDANLRALFPTLLSTVVVWWQIAKIVFLLAVSLPIVVLYQTLSLEQGIREAHLFGRILFAFSRPTDK